jgi:hypothetical protein
MDTTIRLKLGSFTMRATFTNQFALAGPGRENSIKYTHPFRVNVDIYICQNARGGKNWDIQYVTQKHGKVPESIRAALEREFQTYIRLRIKKSVRALSYGDFVDMANAVNIG